MSDSSDDASDDSSQGYARKRRKHSKEDQMLGVFGSEDDEDDSRLHRKKLSNKSVQFSRGQTFSGMKEAEAEASFDDRSAASIDLRQASRSPESSRRSNSPSAGVSMQQPAFGFFQDSSQAFVPKVNLMRSTATQTPIQHQSPAQNAYRAGRTGNGNSTRGMSAPTTSKLQSGKAARMMAMMGYKAGEGLGATKKGIVNPIEAQMRAGQKAGLGSHEDRNDNEARRTKAKSETDKADTYSGDSPVSTQNRIRKPKVMYKTAKEIMLEAGADFVLPRALHTIIDMTGPDVKTIKAMDMSGATNSIDIVDRNQSFRISDKARVEAQTYANQWRALQEQKTYWQTERARQEKELDNMNKTLESLRVTVSEIQDLSLFTQSSSDDRSNLTTTISKLTRSPLSNSICGRETISRGQIVLSILKPLLLSAMSAWQPLAEPNEFVQEFLEVQTILKSDAEDYDDPRETAPRKRSHTDAFDTLMLSTWYTHVRENLSESWNDDQSRQVLIFLDLWADLIPLYLKQHIIEQFVLPYLQSRIRAWQPLKMTNRTAIQWLLPWLLYIGDDVQELTPVMKRKFSASLTQWTPSMGTFAYLDDLKDILGTSAVEKMLVNQILPKLSEELRSNLVIDPADQQLDAVNRVLEWRHQLPASDMIELLRTELFPKWTRMLYDWLHRDPDFGEISQWYEWWQSILPSSLLRTAPIQQCFAKGLAMIDTALELGPEALQALPVGPSIPLDHKQHTAARKASKRANVVTNASEIDITFKDVLENWCANHNYLMLPLRKAHHSGNAMFRITASSNGTGGITIYLRGDVIMKLDREKDTWSAISLAEIASSMRPA